MTPPRVRDWAEFAAIRFDPAVWEPLVVRVLTRHGLPRPSTVELTSSAHAVAVAGDVTVKLYQPLDEEGRNATDSFGVESEALRLLAGAGLPVPTLVATGSLYPDGTDWPWPYVVMSTMPGRPLDEVPGDRREVAASLGRFLRVMHAIRPPDGERFLAQGFLSARLDGCAAEHRRRALLPTHLLAGLDDFIERARPHVTDGMGPAVLTHGDLHAGNVYARDDGGLPRMVGVLDFNDVRLTDPHYDLVVIHLRALGADPGLLNVLMDASGWGPRGDGWTLRMMALTIAHDFDELGDLLRSRPEMSEASSLDELAESIWPQPAR